MLRLFKGVVSGFVATVVMSALMLSLAMALAIPWIDLVDSLAALSGGGRPLGWALHFGIGALLAGGLFPVVRDRLPGRHGWQKSLVFGLTLWPLSYGLLILVSGPLGLSMAEVVRGLSATCAMSLAFGSTLGASFAGMTDEGSERPGSRRARV